VFKPDPIHRGSKQKTVHEELATYLTHVLRIKFTSGLPMVGGSLQVLRLLPPLKLVVMI
jgi:hypothetical protein